MFRRTIFGDLQGDDDDDDKNDDSGTPSVAQMMRACKRN